MPETREERRARLGREVIEAGHALDRAARAVEADRDGYPSGPETGREDWGPGQRTDY